jgi:hypothetical protein
VWQVICVVLQANRQVELAVALLVAVAAVVGAVPGTRHAVWQLADAELQTIMQLVVVDDCASRIFWPAKAWHETPAAIAAAIARRTKPRRMCSALPLDRSIIAGRTGSARAL